MQDQLGQHRKVISSKQTKNELVHLQYGFCWEYVKASSPNLPLLIHYLGNMNSELGNSLFYALEDTLRGALCGRVFSIPISSKLICPTDHWLPMILFQWLQIRWRLPSSRVNDPDMKMGIGQQKNIAFCAFGSLRIPCWKERGGGNSSASRAHFLKGSFITQELSSTQGTEETPAELLPRRLPPPQETVLQGDAKGQGDASGGGGVWTVC